MITKKESNLDQNDCIESQIPTAGIESKVPTTNDVQSQKVPMITNEVQSRISTTIVRHSKRKKVFKEILQGRYRPLKNIKNQQQLTSIPEETLEALNSNNPTLTNTLNHVQYHNLIIANQRQS